MLNKLSPKLITATKLAEEKFKKELPEYYNLRTVVENNSWHLKQTVFDHSVLVLDKFEKLITDKQFSSDTQSNIEILLKQKLENYSKKDLMIIMILLHDLAKADVIVVNQNGTTSCPGHEMLGSTLVTKFKERFGLTSLETKYIQNLILLHGLLHSCIDLILSKKDKNKIYTWYKQVAGKDWLLLALFTIADTQASDLAISDKKEYSKRINLLNELVESI